MAPLSERRSHSDTLDRGDQRLVAQPLRFAVHPDRNPAHAERVGSLILVMQPRQLAFPGAARSVASAPSVPWRWPVTVVVPLLRLQSLVLEAFLD